MDLKVQKMLAETVANANKNTVSPYTTKAEVTSITGDTVYVKIPGSENATPVKASSVSVKVGDIVDLVVSHSDTHITGNRSDVAVSSTTAEAKADNAKSEAITAAAADATNKANEAAKTATNYMNFANDGLTIGNMTASTLGKNVLIDSDSVDIRNGATVLASYGENISLYKNGVEAFTVRNSEFLNYAVNVENNFASISVDENNKYVTASSPSSTPVTFNNDAYYKWKFTYKSKESFVVFTPSTTYSEVTQIVWRENKPNNLYITNNNSSVTEHCVYLDENAVVNLILKGSVRIDNSGDIHGKTKGAPPLSIGTNGGVHLEIDGDEIVAKSNDTTPSSLHLNAEGGTVSINNNCGRSIKFQNGAMFDKKSSGGYADEWVCIGDGCNGSNNTTFGYGNYIKNIGRTNIYGYETNIFSKGNVSANTNFAVPNNKGFVGMSTSGDLRNNFQPCDANNRCVIGLDSYSSNEGATNIYGDYLSLTTNNSYIMNNKAMSIPAISVHSVNTQTLNTSVALISVGQFNSTNNQTTIGSTYFKSIGPGVKCLLSGWIKVSAQISLTGLNANDGVYLYIYKNSTEMYSTYARLNSSGELSIIDHVLKVEAGDVIYIYGRNITAARGTITNDWYGASLTIAYVN